ncbi:MAG: glycosyltransferase family 9 protein [Ignavibacterium sp.]|nr:glycosyltransferase family 9 protein [Ignavibacterium sp.]MDW8375829.1 glycosyltransferase family 9 protein [Ignavibacteriales bacterium]
MNYQLNLTWMIFKKQKRILVVRTDRVGDTTYITPAVRELKKAIPDSFIATLTQPHTSKIFINNPYVDVILTDDLKKENFWKVVKEIRKYKFTHALLMFPTERAAYQLFFAGIPYRVGVGHILYEVITFMRSVSRNNYNPIRHEADYCLDLVRKLGVKTNNYKLEIFLSEEEIREAIDFLKNKGIFEEDKKIFIHTGSLGSGPNWSESKYFSLTKKLLDILKDASIKFIFTAREMSKSFIDEIKKLDPNRIHIIAEEIDDLRMMIKVISQADVFLASSTGPLHIADALNKKCIGIFCRRKVSSAKHHGVINEHSINIEVSEENCKKYCSADQNNCGIEKGLSEEEVINSILKLLNQ